jgi:hypothetical protein
MVPVLTTDEIAKVPVADATCMQKVDAAKIEPIVFMNDFISMPPWCACAKVHDHLFY